MDQGLRLPFLEKYEPDLDQGIMFYWIAWNMLHPGRQRSMGGPSGITMTEMRAFMDEYGVLGRDNRDRFMELIQIIDGHFRKRSHEESSKSAGKVGHAG